MAQRRMFSMKVVGTDQFLDMPVSSQALYFQLGIYADDDGFVTPKKVLRMTGAKEDDLKVLVAKGFVLPFDTGVIVVTHWKENNYLQKDRYTPTIYTYEKQQLSCIQNVYILDTQVRLGKDRKELELEEEKEINSTASGASESLFTEKEKKYNSLGAEVIDAFAKQVDPKNKTYYGNTSQRKACDFLIEEYGLEAILQRVGVLAKTNKQQFFPTITTPVQLRDKWVQLQDAVDRYKTEKITKKPLIIM